MSHNDSSSPVPYDNLTEFKFLSCSHIWLEFCIKLVNFILGGTHREDFSLLFCVLFPFSFPLGCTMEKLSHSLRSALREKLLLYFHFPSTVENFHSTHAFWFLMEAGESFFFLYSDWERFFAIFSRPARAFYNCVCFTLHLRSAPFFGLFFSSPSLAQEEKRLSSEFFINFFFLQRWNLWTFLFSEWIQFQGEFSVNFFGCWTLNHFQLLASLMNFNGFLFANFPLFSVTFPQILLAVSEFDDLELLAYLLQTKVSW